MLLRPRPGRQWGPRRPGGGGSAQSTVMGPLVWGSRAHTVCGVSQKNSAVPSSALNLLGRGSALLLQGALGWPGRGGAERQGDLTPGRGLEGKVAAECWLCRRTLNVTGQGGTLGPLPLIP